MSPRVLAACVALSWGAALAAQQSGAARPVAGAPAANRRSTTNATSSRSSKSAAANATTARSGRAAWRSKPTSTSSTAARTAPSSSPGTAPTACCSSA